LIYHSREITRWHKPAPARKLTFSEAESSDLNRVLLSGILAAHGETTASLRSRSNRLRLLKLSANALSVLDPRSHRKFTEWVEDLDPDDHDSSPLKPFEGNNSRQEIFNHLGDAVFADEAAKARGAIFTPPWLTKRLVSNASHHWNKLNQGKKPAQVADLSCGPGGFLTELASRFSTKTKIIGVDACPECSLN